MRKKFLIANWKMNPETDKEASRLAALWDFPGVVLAAPFVFLPIFSKRLRRAALAAQDVYWEKEGAYTGAVSARMLKALGVEYVIIGHSERRNFFKETDVIINKKIKAALGAGLKAILCIGEPGPIRRKGEPAVKKFIAHQLREDLKSINARELEQKLMVAYEPVWAIGTGRAASPKQIIAAIDFIKKHLLITLNLKRSVVLYGGSVSKKNVLDFLSSEEIDGLLVGGVSLNPSFIKSIRNYK